MKFKKLLAVMLSVAIAATAMLTSAFAVTINGTVEEGDVDGIEINLGEQYPVLLDAASWAAGVEVHFTYKFENEIVPTEESFGKGCGGNAALFIKYGEDYKWKDKNAWTYNDVWMLDKGLEYNKATLQFDTAGAEIKEVGFRIYNFQQQADDDLDDQLNGKGITVEILDILVGGESILTDEPTSEPTSEEPTSEPTSEEPTSEPTSEEPTSEPTSEEPTSEPTSEEPAPIPEGPYYKATVDKAAGTVTISTVNFKDASIYGMQYTISFDGTFGTTTKGTLPEGWSQSYPKEVVNSLTAVYDCDFENAMGDQVIATFAIADVDNVKFESVKAVDDSMTAINEVGAYVEYVAVDSEPTTEPTTEPTSEEPTSEKPADSEAPATSEKPATTEPTTNEPSTGDVNTGVGFASILGVVALAGAVASKKR